MARLSLLISPHAADIYMLPLAALVGSTPRSLKE